MSELGDLLRARREQLRPADVGLDPGPRRRARGLRREEVAGLAAISPTYLAFLEQGRDVRPSHEVLGGLARALRLDAAETAYLHDLVHGAAPTADGPEVLAPGLAELVARQDPCPTYVTGRRWDVLAANDAARLLWTDWDALPVADRNMVWFMFGDPRSRAVFVDWEAEAAAQLARFRVAAGRHAGDAGFAALIARLHAASAEVRAWWPAHAVAPLSSGAKRLRHPALGVLELRHTVLQAAEATEQKLVTFQPAPADVPRIAALLR